MREAVMKENVIRRIVDLKNPPPLTESQKSEIAALALRSESEIDYSDIPPLTEEFWEKAERGRFYRPTKKSTTVRVDSDVLAWLKHYGKGYQTRLNAILRDAMLQSTRNQKTSTFS